MRTLAIWRLRVDVKNYHSLRLAEPEEFYARFQRPFSGLSMAKPEQNLATIKCLVDESNRPAADFTALLPGMFVISQRVYDSRLFMAVMNLAAEVAEVAINGDRRYAVNVVQIFNALDRYRSDLTRTNDGRITSVERYAFYPERIGAESSLFKLPETATQDIFTWHRSGDDAWCNFPEAYRRCGFTGLQFDLLARETE